MSTAVLFLHGLESSPTGNKARHFGRLYGAEAVDLDTRAAIASKDAALAAGRPWDHRCPDIEEAFATPLARARAAIGPDTRLIIGSSFGGAVLLRLLREGSWAGPSLFLASAGPRLTGDARLPPGSVAILIQGRADTIVDPADSQATASQGGPGVTLWEVDDDHRLDATLASGQIDAAIRQLLAGG